MDVDGHGPTSEPDGFDSQTTRHLERRIPLSLDAEIRGDFVTLSYCGHGPWAILEDHASLVAVENAVLSGVGILNGFTDFMLAFIEGKQRSYEVHKDDGRLMARNGMRVVTMDVIDSARDGVYRVVWSRD